MKKQLMGAAACLTGMMVANSAHALYIGKDLHEFHCLVTYQAAQPQGSKPGTIMIREKNFAVIRIVGQMEAEKKVAAAYDKFIIAKHPEYFRTNIVGHKGNEDYARKRHLNVQCEDTLERAKAYFEKDLKDFKAEAERNPDFGFRLADDFQYSE